MSEREAALYEAPFEYVVEKVKNPNLASNAWTPTWHRNYMVAYTGDPRPALRTWRLLS